MSDKKTAEEIINFKTAKEYIEYLDHQTGEQWSVDNETLSDVMEDYAKMKSNQQNQELQRQVEELTLKWSEQCTELRKEVKDHLCQLRYVESQYNKIKEAADEMAYTDTETPEGKLARAKYKQLTQKQNG